MAEIATRGSGRKPWKLVGWDPSGFVQEFGRERVLECSCDPYREDLARNIRACSDVDDLVPLRAPSERSVGFRALDQHLLNTAHQSLEMSLPERIMTIEQGRQAL